MKKLISIAVPVALLLAMAIPVMAAPPTMPPPGAHSTFNCVTEVPVGGLGANEILVPLNGSGMLGFKAGSPFQILDNDMTDGQAWVQVPSGLYDTYDQARGKPGGYLIWGGRHYRSTGKPVWEQHNNPMDWRTRPQGNWPFTNNGITCYSFRLYPLP